MSGARPAASWRARFSGAARKPTVILLLAPLLLTTFKYYGSKSFYLSELAGKFVLLNDPGRTAELWHFCSGFFLLGALPALVVRLVFKESLADYGVQRGDTRFSLKALLILLPVMVALTYPAARAPGFLAEYPVDPGAGSSAAAFLSHAGTYLLYYAGWEFFFRGFMQFGLRGALGDWNAILVQTLASCLIHIGKPAGEIYGAILAGLVWGLLVFRTRSLWPVVLMHWVLGVSLDFFICFTAKGG
jgi:membrane protease YdiL (CAAX protease family)